MNLRPVVVGLLLVSGLRADLVVAPLFPDHAVLQRDLPIVVWGTAAAGEPVRIIFGRDATETTAGTDARWQAHLPARAATAIPQDLVIEGTTRFVATDVLVGDVWLCSGQSNMQMAVQSAAHAQAEIAAAHHPLVREFSVAPQHLGEPSRAVIGPWRVCSPEAVGSFSASSYFFARTLQQHLGIPIGIINSSYGNSPIASWRDASAVGREPAVATWWLQQRQGPTPPRPHRQPSSCYNGMIFPLIPFNLRGILWYQGERDASEVPLLSQVYARQFQGLIQEWRGHFGQDLPFFWVQLAGFGKPGERDWVGVREAQSTALALPHTGQAIALDIGDATDIHPKNKQAIGDRLARLALHRVYGVPIADTGHSSGELREEFFHSSSARQTTLGTTTSRLVAMH